MRFPGAAIGGVPKNCIIVLMKACISLGSRASFVVLRYALRAPEPFFSSRQRWHHGRSQDRSGPRGLPRPVAMPAPRRARGCCCPARLRQPAGTGLLWPRARRRGPCRPTARARRKRSVSPPAGLRSSTDGSQMPGPGRSRLRWLSRPWQKQPQCVEYCDSYSIFLCVIAKGEVRKGTWTGKSNPKCPSGLLSPNYFYFEPLAVKERFDTQYPSLGKAWAGDVGQKQ